MPVAIDTSVLIHAEKAGGFAHLLPDDEGIFYIPGQPLAFSPSLRG
jgi:hypothetical protein